MMERFAELLVESKRHYLDKLFSDEFQQRYKYDVDNYDVNDLITFADMNNKFAKQIDWNLMKSNPKRLFMKLIDAYEAFKATKMKKIDLFASFQADPLMLFDHFRFDICQHS